MVMVSETHFADELMVALCKTKNSSRAPSATPSPDAYAPTDAPTLSSDAPSPTPTTNQYPTSMGFALVERSVTVTYVPVAETEANGAVKSSLKRTWASVE